VFASNDPVNATERLVVMAETREEDADRREILRQKINEAAVAGGRHAGRRGGPGAAQFGTQDVQWQDSSQCLARRLRAWPDRRWPRAGTACSCCAWRRGATRPLGRIAVLRVCPGGPTVPGAGRSSLLLAIPVIGLVIALRAPPIGRRVVHRAARIFLFLAGMPVPTHGDGEAPVIATPAAGQPLQLS
jgi:hypothetical protein